MSFTTIYKDSEELVKVLKKTLKPYKSAIKANTSRNQRFALVKIEKLKTLDKCGHYLRSNDFKFNEFLDRKLNKICRKYCPVSEDTNGISEEPVPKKRKVVDTLIDLNLINNQNEDLDFEDETDGLTIRSTDPKPQSKLTNGFPPKDKSSKSYSNGFTELNGRQETNGLPLFGNNLNQSFKIPKKISQNIETIISHANSLSKRPAEAYKHLNRHLTEELWKREDVIELLLNITKNMVAFNQFGGHLNDFNQLVNKLKSLKYTENDFWDELIYSVDRKRNDLKNSHIINEFLSNLYDYMSEHEICARVVCTEAVVTAYRIQTNHPSVKDLAELGN